MADIGWLELSAGNTYFVTRFGETDWNALNDDQKTAVLTTAYNRLRYCKEFDLPTSPSTAEKLILADAQCEMAKYMMIHLADEDRRKGIQAQGVLNAGVVQEAYVGHLAYDDKMGLLKLPIPPIVYHILDGWYKHKTVFGAVNLERDEEESVNTKVHDF